MSKVKLNLKEPKPVTSDLRCIEPCKLTLVKFTQTGEQSVVIVPQHADGGSVVFFDENDITYSDLDYFYYGYTFVRYLTEDDSVILRG